MLALAAVPSAPPTAPAAPAAPPTVAQGHRQLVHALRQAKATGDAAAFRRHASALLGSISGGLYSRAMRLHRAHRGTCEVEDLVQVARLTILDRVLRKSAAGRWHFDPDAADFLGWAFRDAEGAMKREMQRQGFDVHASDRDRSTGVAAPVVHSNDAPGGAWHRPDTGWPSDDGGRVTTRIEGKVAAYHMPAIEGTPESLFTSAHDSAALHRALALLSIRQRAVIVRLYGLGCERRSARAIMAELHIAQATVERIRMSALEVLTTALNSGQRG